MKEWLSWTGIKREIILIEWGRIKSKKFRGIKYGIEMKNYLIDSRELNQSVKAAWNWWIVSKAKRSSYWRTHKEKRWDLRLN